LAQNFWRKTLHALEFKALSVPDRLLKLKRFDAKQRSHNFQVTKTKGVIKTKHKNELHITENMKRRLKSE
jgi:hypothetical protein